MQQLCFTCNIFFQLLLKTILISEQRCPICGATVVNWPCEEVAYSCCQPCVQLSGHPVPNCRQAVFNGALWAGWIKHWWWAMVEASCRKGCKHTGHKREWDCQETEQFVIVLLYFQEVCFSVSVSYLNHWVLQRFTLKTFKVQFVFGIFKINWECTYQCFRAYSISTHRKWFHLPAFSTPPLSLLLLIRFSLSQFGHVLKNIQIKKKKYEPTGDNKFPYQAVFVKHLAHD